MNQTSRLSIVGRAILALLLTVGFYGLALGIAFGLFYLIYLQVVVFERIDRLTVLAFIGAVVILLAIFPRLDRFTAPGLLLTREKFPALFKEIEKIAQATRQEMPREVYLVPDVNAFVAERGGIVGIGTRRVMGIGLPLLHLMTVDELNSVLVHEFGHFYGGDTALGPWIYKTRSAIIRTVMSLGQTNQLLVIPFEAYAKIFLRVTNAVSRQQEYMADKLAAQSVGAKATITGLQKVHKYGIAFDAFFRQEYLPVIDAGYQPPMLNGFELFLKAPKITEAVNKYYDEQLTQGKANPYDTHPSLKERIAALENYPAGKTINDHPASTLLPNNEKLESLILREIIVQKEKANHLKEIAWDDVVELAFVPQWEKSVQSYKEVLKDLTPSKLFGEAQNIPKLFETISIMGKILPSNVKPSQVPQDAQVQIINNVIGSALAYALKHRGWKIKTNPGEDLIFWEGKKEFHPFTVFPQLAARQTSAEEWKKVCDENEISDISLA